MVFATLALTILMVILVLSIAFWVVIYGGAFVLGGLMNSKGILNKVIFLVLVYAMWQSLKIGVLQTNLPYMVLFFFFFYVTVKFLKNNAQSK